MLPVSRKALGETGQNDAGFVGREGHSKFLQKQRFECAKPGKIIAAVVLAGLQGKGPAMDIGVGCAVKKPPC